MTWFSFSVRLQSQSARYHMYNNRSIFQAVCHPLQCANFRFFCLFCNIFNRDLFCSFVIFESLQFAPGVDVLYLTNQGTLLTMGAKRWLYEAIAKLTSQSCCGNRNLIRTAKDAEMERVFLETVSLALKNYVVILGTLLLLLFDLCSVTKELLFYWSLWIYDFDLDRPWHCLLEAQYLAVLFFATQL